MKTLYAAFPPGEDRPKIVEIADAIICLANAIDEETVIQRGPGHLRIDEKGTVFASEQADDDDLCYFAPEVLLEGKRPDKAASWFTLGLLMYFMLHGDDWYAVNHARLTELPERKKASESLITVKNASRSASECEKLLDRACAELTAWDPAVRVEGVRTILQAVSLCESWAVISYLCHSKTVATVERQIVPPACNLTGEIVRDKAGNQYRVENPCSLSFRPGSHNYRVPVEQLPESAVREYRPSVRFLSAQLADGSTSDLMTLADHDQTYVLHTNISDRETVTLYLVDRDPNTNSEINAQEFCRLGGQRGQKAFPQAEIRLIYTPPNRIQVYLTPFRQRTQSIGDFRI